MKNRSLLYRRIRFVLIVLVSLALLRACYKKIRPPKELEEIPLRFVDAEKELEEKAWQLDASGKMLVKDPDSFLSLINKDIALPKDYEPSDLIVPKVPFSFEEDLEKKLMRREPAKKLEELFQASLEEGLELYAVSGYRSARRQQALFNNKEAKDGLDEAQRLVAQPGHSEHQSGLAMDVSSRSVNLLLEEAFEDSPEGIWVRDNAHRFGFVIRYAKDKEDITLYSYEPWHLRYVGLKHAKAMYENNLSLEEYLKYK